MSATSCKAYIDGRRDFKWVTSLTRGRSKRKHATKGNKSRMVKPSFPPKTETYALYPTHKAHSRISVLQKPKKRPASALPALMREPPALTKKEQDKHEKRLKESAAKLAEKKELVVKKCRQKAQTINYRQSIIENVSQLLGCSCLDVMAELDSPLKTHAQREIKKAMKAERERLGIVFAGGMGAV